MALKKKSKIRDPSYAVKIRGNRKHIAPITLCYRLAETGQIVSGTKTAGHSFLDLAQGLSIVGRRLNRQGKCYYISNIALVQNSGFEAASASVQISTLPNTWWTANAWVKAFSAWSQMRKEVLENQPSLKARWADFKVFMTKDMSKHHTDGYGFPMPQVSTIGAIQPFVYNNSGDTKGEWDYSEFTQPDHTVGGTANDYYGHMLGTNNGTTWANMVSAGLVDAYELSRARVQEKDETGSPQDGMYSNLFDLGGQEEDLTEDIIKEGALAPYDMADMSNVTGSGDGAPPITTILNVNTGLPIANASGFPVPLGLLKVEWMSSSTSYPPQLIITMTPGKYNGVHAETMGQ